MSWVCVYYFYPLPLDGIEVELKGGEICQSPARTLDPTFLTLAGLSHFAVTHSQLDG